ncbi:MAG: GspE/PulE family protein [bacterium]|nr:GspE/PulE family protein [bacterium]
MSTLLSEPETQQLAALIEQSSNPQQVVDLVDKLMELSVVKGASDVHIEPFETEAVARFRIDGILHDAVTLPRPAHDRILARIKVLANLKIDEHRMPQDGRSSGRFGDRLVDFRVATLPQIFGEKIVLRVLPRDLKAGGLKDLGFSDQAVKPIEQHVRRPYGMILVCGPTGSGKSTTLYTLIQKLLDERGTSANVSTIEDPVEYAIPRVNQIQVGIGTGMSFEMALRGLLRQDADVIMVGEIRDRETAEAAIEASLTGRLLLSSLHTRDAVGALIRLLEIGIEPYLVSSSISLIVAQRLVRLICTGCVESYALDEPTYKDLVERYHLDRIIMAIEERVPQLAPIPSPPRLFRGKGCDACMYTGYRGRTAIFEVLEASDAFRVLAGKRATAAEFRDQAIGEGMITMLQEGFYKALSGQTTLEEVLKATLE